MFSATFPPHVEALAKRAARRAAEVVAGVRSVADREGVLWGEGGADSAEMMAKRAFSWITRSRLGNGSGVTPRASSPSSADKVHRRGAPHRRSLS